MDDGTRFPASPLGILTSFTLKPFSGSPSGPRWSTPTASRSSCARPSFMSRTSLVRVPSAAAKFVIAAIPRLVATSGPVGNPAKTPSSVAFGAPPAT